MLAEVDRLERILSGYPQTSELTRWQASHGAVGVSPELADMLHAADAWRAHTDGAFNPVAVSLIELLRTSAPLDAHLREMRQPLWSVDRTRGVAHRITSLAFSLDALAKGYIVDCVAAGASAVDGVTQVLVNIGGDLRHYGDRPVAVNIADPRAPAENAPPISVVRPLEGQQAGVVLNMINFATGQLFDWFVSDHQVFALVERLPSNVTNPMLAPGDPGYVGMEKAYTQIVKTQDVKPGKKYDVAIRYSRSHTTNRVEFFLDGKLFATVNNVGIPLDVQGVNYTGTYPSLGPGEDLRGQLNSFVIGHGLFSLLDAYPFQHPERPDLSVSIPMSERLFGQGASATYSKFKVTTKSD